MTFLFMLIGALFGAWACAAVFDEPTGFTGAFFGLVVGMLFAQLRTLRARVAELEAAGIETVALPAGSAPAAAQPTPVAAAAPAPPTSARAETPAPAMARTPSPDASAKPTFEMPAGETPAVEMRVPDVVAAPAAPRMSEPQPLTAVERAVDAIRGWFTEGNVPVKVGVIVLFLGVAALLKYAADQGWLTMPMEFRLAGIAVAALGALVFAWRKRESHRAFALSLQGGAIGVLILTIFAAFKLYALLPAPFAFAMLVMVVAGGALLAVLQDAVALAVLAIVGGFLAPILISTGQGNHVALFTYYAVLNAAVFAIAWIKPWRALNLIGFAFTFGIGTLWGALQYKPEFFASTEPFLLLFFAFYLLLPLLYAIRKSAAEGGPPSSLAREAGEGGTARGTSGGVRAEGRQAPDRRDLIDGTLVFGTPLIVFALQVALLERARMPLAFSAIGAAAIYMLLATLELRRWRLTLLGESHALLALGFATIAIPLALSARSTACTWAIEGAALVWLGLRQERRLPRWIGYALQLFAGLAFASNFHVATDAGPIVNGDFLGAILIALAGFVSARLLDRAEHRPLTTLLFAWGLLWWLFAFGNEIERHAGADTQASWWLALAALTGAIAGELYRRIDWLDCRYVVAGLFAVAPLFIALTMNDGTQGPLERGAALAWALWLVVALRALVNLREADAQLPRILHFVFLWTVALLLGVELGFAADRHLLLGPIWVALAGFVPIAALFWLALTRAGPARWPLDDEAEPLRHPLLASLAGLMSVAWVLGLAQEGDPAPLPYVPLVNPLELAQLGFLLLMLAWFNRGEREGGAMLGAELRARVLAAAGVLLLTAVTLRGVHFIGGVPWDESMASSPLAQASLSISWTLAGIAAMLLGKRRNSRAVWFGGAALMAVVLVKLLLIDRQFLHDLPAIIGVLVVGILLVAVGYFAPVPPRVPAAATGEAA